MPKVLPPQTLTDSNEYGEYSNRLGGYDKRKRYRRTANEIERRFVCWSGKAYGSDGSLNIYKKFKGHNLLFLIMHKSSIGML